MSFFRLFFPLLLVFAAFLHLSLLNPGDTELVWARGYTVRLPVIVLLMAFFFLGAAALSAVNFLKGAGEAFDALEARLRGWKVRRIESGLIDVRLKARQGMTARALETLEKLLEDHPRHYEALLLKGDVLRGLGRHAEALGAHSLALSLRPAAREAALRIKDDYKAAGNWDAAHDLLERMRERWPNDMEVLADMREVNLARGDFRLALLAQKELLAGADENTRVAGQVKMAEIALLYGERLMADGKPEAAREQFAAAALIQPDFLAARMLLAGSLAALQLPQEAEAALMKEFRRTRNLIPLLRLAAMARATGGAVKELETVERGIEAAPEEKLLPLIAAVLEIENRLFDPARGRIVNLDAAVAALPMAAVAKGLLELHAAAAPDDAAIATLERALALEWAAFIKYRCQACGVPEADYFPQCPSCGAWNAAALHIEGYAAV